MSYNNDNFIDMMDSINNIARGIGFKNGIDWAASAQQNGEISYLEYKQYSNCHNLRIRMAHGNAKDIFISDETYWVANEFYNNIQTSGLFKTRKNVRLPEGTFRTPYKRFHLQGQDGNFYDFKLSVVYEYNYFDNGIGGDYGTGYFIHILEAPYYNYALQYLHEFHIISGKIVQEVRLHTNTLVENASQFKL